MPSDPPQQPPRPGSPSARIAALVGARWRRPSVATQAALWPVALLLGVAVGYAVIGFRLAISGLQTLFYGADDLMLHSVAAMLPWYSVMAMPVLGGLVTGWILSRYTPDATARGVSDVIRA